MFPLLLLLAAGEQGNPGEEGLLLYVDGLCGGAFRRAHPNGTSVLGDCPTL
jgi:hypothetical protein